MSDEELDCDLLVIGAGMAGLCAAARAAEGGARVVVVEKANDIGGSAILSGGYVWTVPSRKHLVGCDDGDPELGAVVIDGYADAIAWLRHRDVVISPLVRVLHGRGFQIDIIRHVHACAATVTSSGGHVVPDTLVKHLITDADGRVAGARTKHADGAITVRACFTLLATGGFQADADLRATHINPQAAHFMLRSNPNSRGDGLRLAKGAGGVFAGPNPGFYGHLLCYPANLDDPAKRNTLYRTLAQYHSDYGLLFDRQGRRFCDESRGDHLNNQEVAFLRDARALLVWDRQVHDKYAMVAHAPGAVPVDRLEVALAQGAQGARCDSIADLGRAASTFGFDGVALVCNLDGFNRAARDAPERISPPRSGDIFPQDQPPFRMVVVQPAITFTHGGVRIDERARALNSLGQPIPGLLVAGADAGNIYRRGYAGGLALALTYGLRAAATAGYS